MARREVQTHSGAQAESSLRRQYPWLGGAAMLDGAALSRVLNRGVGRILALWNELSKGDCSFSHSRGERRKLYLCCLLLHLQHLVQFIGLCA